MPSWPVPSWPRVVGRGGRGHGRAGGAVVTVVVVHVVTGAIVRDRGRGRAVVATVVVHVVTGSVVAVVVGRGDGRRRVVAGPVVGAAVAGLVGRGRGVRRGPGRDDDLRSRRRAHRVGDGEGARRPAAGSTAQRGLRRIGGCACEAPVVGGCPIIIGVSRSREPVVDGATTTAWLHASVSASASLEAGLPARGERLPRLRRSRPT